MARASACTARSFAGTVGCCATNSGRKALILGHTPPYSGSQATTFTPGGCINVQGAHPRDDDDSRLVHLEVPGEIRLAPDLEPNHVSGPEQRGGWRLCLCLLPGLRSRSPGVGTNGGQDEDGNQGSSSGTQSHDKRVVATFTVHAVHTSGEPDRFVARHTAIESHARCANGRRTRGVQSARGIRTLLTFPSTLRQARAGSSQRHARQPRLTRRLANGRARTGERSPASLGAVESADAARLSFPNQPKRERRTTFEEQGVCRDRLPQDRPARPRPPHQLAAASRSSWPCGATPARRRDAGHRG